MLSTLLDNKKMFIEVRKANDCYYYSETEYDIKKEVCVKDENNVLYFRIDYRDCYSQISNGGSFHLDTHYYFKPNNNYPEGYTLSYCLDNSDGISFQLNGIKYDITINDQFLLPTILKTINDNTETYFIKENAFYKRMYRFNLGLNLETENIQILYSAFDSPEMDLQKCQEILESKDINVQLVTSDIKETIKLFEVSKNLINSFPYKETFNKIIDILDKKLTNEQNQTPKR